MNILKSPIFLTSVVVALLVLGLGIVLAIAHAKPNRSQWGFRDLIKNPNKFLPLLVPPPSSVERAITEAQGWNDAKLEAHVKHFLFQIPNARAGSVEMKALQSLGHRTRAVVFKILKDDQYAVRLATPTSDGLFHETPFMRACILLQHEPTPDIIPALAPFTTSADADTRQAASWAIAHTGHPESLPYLHDALRDEAENVREFAVIALGRFYDPAALHPEWRSSLFDDVWELLPQEGTDDEAAMVLLALDRPLAARRFIETITQKPLSAGTFHMIHALTEAGELVPRNQLSKIINQLGQKSLNYSESRLLRETLRAYGAHRIPEDRPLLEAYLAHGDDDIAEGASAGLIESHGLRDYDQRVWQKAASSGHASLSIPQRHFSAVMDCDAEIKNGGLDQYFFNSSGDEWPDAIAGFEAMGCPQHAAVLREATALFGSDGPSQNRETRMSQLSKLARKNDTLLRALDSRYYDCKGNLEVQIGKYVIKNADAFR